mgnify:FL=1
MLLWGRRGFVGGLLVKVRELASRVRTLKKAGESKPFVAVNVKRHCIGFVVGLSPGVVAVARFLPPNCSFHVALNPAGEEREKSDKAGKNKAPFCLRLFNVVLLRMLRASRGVWNFIGGWSRGIVTRWLA